MKSKLTNILKIALVGVMIIGFNSCDKEDCVKGEENTDEINGSSDDWKIVDNGDGTCQILERIDNTPNTVENVITIPTTINNLKVTKIKNEVSYTSIFGSKFSSPDTTITSVDMSKAKYLKNIGDYTFVERGELTSITIPNSVTSIGNYAFNTCTSLTSITIPNSVTHIGNYAFSYCYSLTGIKISDGVTSIEEGTFKSCEVLTSITIPNSVTSIDGTEVFYSCSALTNISAPSHLNIYEFKFW